MSSVATATSNGPAGLPSPNLGATQGAGAMRILPRVLTAAGLICLIVMPYYTSALWLQVGLFTFSAVIAALGLNLLTGVAGQLSLGHSFFVAIGAYAYSFLAGDTSGGLSGLGWPPVLAAVAAVFFGGVAGAVISPIAGRIRGIYLGVATLGLVFVGLHLIYNLTEVTGGAPGRSVTPLSVLGFHFASSDPDLVVAGVPFGRLERLWYLSLVLAVVAYMFARNLQRGRVGRGLRVMRDSELAATAMGVNVPRYKAMAFVLSSMFAATAGIVLALGFSQIEPSSFGLTASIDYIAMVVIGGLGSTSGAVLGAVFITVLPRLLDQFGGFIPFLDNDPAGGGVSAADLARYIFGALIVVVVLFRPRGLITLLDTRPRRKRRGRA